MAALPLINVLAGLGGIAAGVGFGVAEKKKMKKLTEDSKELSIATTAAGDFYNHTYYLVAVNLQRVTKAVTKLPDDFLQKVQDDISNILSGGDGQKALAILGQIMGYGGAAVGTLSGIIKIVRKVQANRRANNEPDPTNAGDAESPWRGQPESEGTPPTPETIPVTPKINRLLTGLDVAGAVLSVGGLLATIGLGVWTIIELNNAIDEVKTKQTDVDKLTKGMTGQATV